MQRRGKVQAACWRAGWSVCLPASWLSKVSACFSSAGVSYNEETISFRPAVLPRVIRAQ